MTFLFLMFLFSTLTQLFFFSFLLAYLSSQFFSSLLLPVHESERLGPLTTDHMSSRLYQVSWLTKVWSFLFHNRTTGATLQIVHQSKTAALQMQTYSEKSAWNSNDVMILEPDIGNPDAERNISQKTALKKSYTVTQISTTIGFE